MNLRTTILSGLLVVVLGVFSMFTPVLAQNSGWAPPTSLPPTGNVAPVVNVGSASQIKRGALGIDLGATLSTFPVGTGLYIKAGSLFVEYMGTGALSSWSADSNYAISTSGRIKGHGLSSSAELQSDLLKLAGQTGERQVCADNYTGKLKICGVALGPSVTLTADTTNISAPSNVTLTWGSTNAVSCTGVNFSTGTGSPTSGSKVVAQGAESKIYIVSCVDSFGSSSSKSLTVTYTAPAIVTPTVTVTATPTTVASGGTSTVAWSSTNATSCVAITPSPSSFTTNNATAGSQAFALTNSGASATTVTFAVRCTSSTNTTTDASVSVAVSAVSAPTVTLTASPTALASGSQLTTLTWSSSNANSCTGSGGTFTTNGATSGSTTLSQSVTTTYTVTCQNTTTGQTGSANVIVTTSSAVPTITWGFNPGSLPAGNQSTVVTWSSTNATSCTGSGGVFNTNGQTSGTQTLTQNTTTVYNISCTGPGGTKTGSFTVTSAAPSLPTVTLSANPTTIVLGLSSTLTWSSTNTTSCTGTGFNTSGTTSGTISVSPTTSTQYTITCTGAGGSVNKTVMVNVATPAMILWTEVVSPYFDSSTSTVPLKISWAPMNGLETYYQSCVGTNFNTSGATSGTATLSMQPANAPIVNCIKNSSAPSGAYTISPASVTVPENSQRTWSSLTASYCELPFSVPVPILANIGSSNFSVSSDFNAQYFGDSMNCWNSTSVRSFATAVKYKPYITIYSGTSNVTTVTLNWQVGNAAACRINGGSPILGSGNKTTTISKTTNSQYTLQCVGTGGYTSQVITVP